MLFRAAGVEGGQQMTALVTPTSTGVRAALRREEIEFSLPLFRGGGEEEEAGSQPECDSTNEFLESLGIEADSLPGLSSHAPKNRLAAGAGSSQVRINNTHVIFILTICNLNILYCMVSII